tara:strand:- start:131 stop:715 length:585 start_codon:yes stop_codon:yes gene_type:complete
VPIPSKIRQGDYVQWRIPSTTDVFGNSISSPDWSVKYYLRTNAGPIGATINSSVHSDGFEFTIASNVTQTFPPGDWFYQAVAEKSGAEKQTILSGTFEVIASLVYSGTPLNFDGRLQIEKDLETIETAIRNIISGGAIQEYKIGTRTAKKYELTELRLLKGELKAELIRAKQAEIIDNGLGNPRTTFVRFDRSF